MGYSMNLAPHQIAYVQGIIAQGRSDHITTRGHVIAIATVCVESGIWDLASAAYPDSLNYPHDGVARGDYDSVGLFQQRAAWGSMFERMTLRPTAHLFFTGGHEGQRGLVAFNYSDTSRTIGQWAQAVQVSAFPDRYDAWADFATACVARYGTPVTPPVPPVKTWKDGLPTVSAAAVEAQLVAADGVPNKAVRLAFKAAALRGCGPRDSKLALQGVVDAADRGYAHSTILAVQRQRKSAINGVLSQDDLHYLGGTTGGKFHALP